MPTAAAAGFLSWVRRGLASRITGQPAMRPQVDVTVELNELYLPTAALKLVTPLEIIGFDPRAVSRLWPRSGATDAEANYFPLIEFHEADLPWRYTPAAALPSGRLTPWLCLLVLKLEPGPDSPEGTYTPPSGSSALGRVVINANVAMPHLSQAWAWAHAHLSGADPIGGAITPAVISAALEEAPQTVVSRLLCPRRLDASVRYTAFLVPTFRQGVDTGLGVTSTAGVQDLAWAGGTSGDGLTLPVYMQWSFRTGPGGDFESLVRNLKPQVLPETIGLRGMDVWTPGGGLPPTDNLLAVEGALKGPSTVSTVWPTTEKATFVAALAALVNSPDDVVAPPVYGRWPARWTPTLSASPLAEPETLPWWRRHGAWRPRRVLAPTVAGTPPVWLQRLNEDPRTRVAAGLGTRVVQDEQRQLMASAWQQLGAVRDINALLRKAQFARELSKKLHARYVTALGADAVLLLTKPLQGRVKQGSKTILDLVRHSPPRQAILSGAWRRLARPLGSLGRRQGKPDQPPTLVVTQVNAGIWKADAGQPAPTNLVTHGWLAALAKRRGPRRFVPDRSSPYVTYETWVSPPPTATIVNGQKRPTPLAWDPVYDPKPATWPVGLPGPQPPATDSPSMDRFRTAARAFAERVTTPIAGELLTQLAIPTLVATVTSAIDPVTTIPAALADRVVKAVGFNHAPVDPIEPVMAYPEFPQPMYRPLADASQDWILPGLADVPADSVSLALTNQAFIEAYMVGLNHEMARELLWNEYPTDQRGSCFRQFWDATGFVTADESPITEPLREGMRDITPIHTWPAVSDLGTHKAAGTAQLVLLVRGEVFRRYPGTTVYAVKGRIVDPLLPTELPLEETAGTHLSPAFSGRLPSDVAFFGFNLTEGQAKGTHIVGDEGYFFCFQEQPGEPRFGLDALGSGDPTAWDTLAWPQLETPYTPSWMKGGFRVHRTPAPVTYINLDSAFPDTSVVADEPLPSPDQARWHADAGAGAGGALGADLAYITYRKPVRLLIHASEMLP